MKFLDDDSNSKDKDLLKRVEAVEDEFDEDGEKKGITRKIIDNLKALELRGPETDVKTLKKDLLAALLELLP